MTQPLDGEGSFGLFLCVHHVPAKQGPGHTPHGMMRFFELDDGGRVEYKRIFPACCNQGQERVSLSVDGRLPFRRRSSGEMLEWNPKGSDFRIRPRS